MVETWLATNTRGRRRRRRQRRLEPTRPSLLPVEEWSKVVPARHRSQVSVSRMVALPRKAPQAVGNVPGAVPALELQPADDHPPHLYGTHQHPPTHTHAAAAHGDSMSAPRGNARRRLPSPLPPPPAARMFTTYTASNSVSN